MRRLRATVAFSAGLALALLAAGPITAAPTGSTDAAASSSVFDKSSAIVTLKALPLSTYDGKLQGYEKLRPSNARLNPNSAAAKKYLGYLKQQHSDFQKWLQANVPSAKVTSEYFVTLNAVAVRLNGAAIGKLANSPYVESVEYVTLYRPTMSESYKLINASPAWAAAGGRADAGAGVKVGIIDTGIDVDHPFFDPSGFTAPAGFPKCDARDSSSNKADTNCKYTSGKVIVAKVFNNNLNQNGFDARAAQDHGTHVSGTVAGVTGKTATVQGVAIDDMSGVAPGAWLGNYNVFPGDVTNARSEDILNAVEAAVNDGMDVLNLSLGGGYNGNNDLLANGLDDAVAAGVVVAVAAGNSGPGSNTIESPGRARNVITVGASTNQHFIGQPFTYPSGGGTTIGAAVGDFDPLPTGSYGLFDTASTACTTVAAGASGKLAIVNRGGCTFSTKVRSAIAAGAVGVVVVNNVAGDPTAMATDGLGGDDLPAVMIGKAEGAALRTAAPTTADANASFQEFITTNGDIIAGFSSRGPTSVDFAVKPDLTSVGVNVLSSIPLNSGDDWAFFSGTSMATPHIAGSAAVLLGLHPSWTPAEVKSALVNTADRVVKDSTNGTAIVGPLVQGVGRENLGDASTAEVTFWPISASFGKVSGSQNVPATMSITLTNQTGTALTFSISKTRYTSSGPVAGDSRILLPGSISVPASGTATFTIAVQPGITGVVQGWVDLTPTSGASQSYSLAYLALEP
ncbi:MAG TPA: S8 family serine peptidase [Candidatus Limnocylindrales bacterium]